MTLEQLRIMVANNNQMYAEEGTYKGWNLIEINDYFILSWIDMTEDFEVLNFHVIEDDVESFLGKLEFDLNNGDPEFCIEGCILSVDDVRKAGGEFIIPE
jgi:hypothetical protein